MQIFRKIKSGLTALLSRPPRSPEDRRIPPAGRTAAGIFVTPDNALQNPVVFACHRYLTQTFAQLPARVMRENPQTGSSERMRSSPVNWVLVWRTSPEYAPFQFKETLLGWALMWGNGYAEIERDNAGRVIALHPIHPQRVCVERWAETNELVYRVSNETGFVYIEPNGMFHLRGWGDGPYGIGIIEYAAKTIGWAQATELFGSTFFGEGLNPAGVIESPKTLTLEGRENLRQELEAIHKGPRRSNRWAFLDAGMKLQKLSTQPNDAQFIETMQHQVEAICRFFGVPPHKVQHLLRMTNNNIEHQAIEVVTDAITPWVLRFEQECNYKLFGQNRQLMFVKLDLKGLLRGAFKDRQEGLRVMRQNGIISADEWRELEDMGPIGEEDGGEKRIVQMNMTTLQRVGEEPAAAPTAAAPETDMEEDDTEDEDADPEEAESPDELDAKANIALLARMMEISHAH